MTPAGEHPLITATCRFDTARLRAVGWHAARLAPSDRLPDVMIGLLTPAVTAPLPAAWHGHYNHDRAQAWIAERDRDGTTLLVQQRTDAAPVGLVILGASPLPDPPDTVEVRLGYLLARQFWGRGLATELVAGVVGWCRTQPVSSILAGVSIDNPASAAVLTNNGFEEHTTRDGEVVFRLTLSPPPSLPATL